MKNADRREMPITKLRRVGRLWQRRLLLVLSLGAFASICAQAGEVSYSMFMGGLDLLGGDYCVQGVAGEGRFAFRTSPENTVWTELLVKAQVNGKELPKFILANGDTDVAARDRYDLLYTNAEAQATLSFLPHKVVLALTLHRATSRAIRSVSIGFGQRTDSDYVFDPFLAYQPYHEYPISETRRIAPGLASPPPWLFSYRKEGRSCCWSAALEPDPDKISFAEFQHVPEGDGRFGWTIVYRGLPAATGDFVVPPIVLRFGDADYCAALQRHVNDLRTEGKIKVPERHLPEWHRETLACTWRFQSEPPRREKATEENCEAYVKMLDDNHIPFGTLIIDDFWGKEHGIWEADPKKWKDLRGFIDRMHAKGRHVLLWICTDGEGLPANERIGSMWDLDSPAFQARLKTMARQMLSAEAGCYDADGVKFDFTSSFASGGAHQRDFGCGYLLRRFEMLSAALLAVKPEALLDYQCYNPYFTHTLTMLRLNDYFGAPEHGLREMRLRARMASICAPGALIDTDHVGFRKYSYRGAYDFIRSQHELGVRSLYMMPEDLKDAEFMAALRTWRLK